jgi:hypothetical protein
LFDRVRQARLNFRSNASCGAVHPPPRSPYSGRRLWAARAVG